MMTYLAQIIIRSRSELVTFHGQVARVTDSEIVQRSTHVVLAHFERLVILATHAVYIWTGGGWVRIH